MPLREIYVKLIVGFPRDPKVRALARYGADAGLARDLYVQMLLYCKENLSDGFVPAEEVGVLAYPLPPDHANQLAKQLASVGLIKEVSKNETHGWLVLAYLRRNGSKKDVENLSRVRAESGRKGGRPSRKDPAHSAAQANGNQVGKQLEKQNKSRPNPYTETESSSDARATEPPSDTRPPDDDDLTSAAIDAFLERTERLLTDAEAKAVAAKILARAPAGTTVAHPANYVAAAIAKAPDPFSLLDEPPPLRELLADNPAPPVRLCGQCDPRTRMREDADGRPYRCPDCHPNARLEAS